MNFKAFKSAILFCLLCGGIAIAAPHTVLAKDLKTSIHGIGQQSLKDDIEKSLNGVTTLPDKADAESVRYQAEKVRQTIIKALAAQGYYQPDVNVKVNESKRKADYIIATHAQTTIASIHFKGQAYPLQKLKPGQPLLAQAVLDEQKQIFDSISKSACVFGLKVDHLAILDTVHHTADLQFEVTDKGGAHFGGVRFKGLDKVREDYARALINLKPGQCYKDAAIEKAQADLLQSGLFSLVRVHLPDQPDKKDAVPVTIEVKERKSRTIKAGLTYYTDEGPGVQLGWENRNILGRGEKFNTDIKVSALEQSIKNTLAKPMFLRKDQTLTIGGDVSRQNTDAYDALTLSLHGDVARKLNKRLTVGLGGGYDVSHINDNESSDNFALLYGLGYADWDNRDNTLDSHKGYKARLDLQPFINTLDPSNIFWKMQSAASTYFALAPKSKIDPVIALRGRYGSIFGQSTLDIPATQRFFAGGGGSVRGFAYQDIGPRNDEDKPAGGRSVVETSAELRFKITDTIGAATFLDGGTVSANSIPDIQNGYAWGAGAGLRYYTPFGPLRFDIGVPLNDKTDAGAAYAIYISLGQAF